MLRGLAAIAAVGVLSPALAGEGRIPIYQQTDIVQAGSYVLTRDFSVASGRAIGIYADDVTLDLNGHTISSGASDWAVITVGSLNGSGIRIRNGRLVGGRYGVSAQATKRLFVERVEIKGATVHGIDLQGTGYFEIVSCVFIDTGTRGLNASGSGGISSGRVIDNFISGSQDIGILLTNFSDGDVSGNQVELTGAPSSAITIQTLSGSGLGGNLIARNRIRHDGQSGITLPGDVSRNLVVDNVIRFVGAAQLLGAGIETDSAGNYIARNVVADHLYGVKILGGGNHLEGNKISGSQYGIYFAAGTDNSYRDNVLLGNSLGPVGGGGAPSAINGGGNIP